MKTYSPFIETVYDQPEPVGTLGRGTHYSVFRAPVWHDEHLQFLARAHLLTFAIIWDEDHDERVVQVVEQMLFRGLLAPVMYIGERKGSLTVSVFPSTAWSVGDYEARVADLVPSDDPWGVTACRFDEAQRQIINDESDRVALFLRHINDLHGLGHGPADGGPARVFRLRSSCEANGGGRSADG